MKLFSLHIALFTSDLISRPDLLMNNINDKIGHLLDSMPTIMNLPLDVPAEIPLAQISSNNGMYRLNVSRNRVDFIISPNYEEDNTPASVAKSYKGIIEKAYRAVLNTYDIKRIGIVINMFEERNENVKAVYDKYLVETMPEGTSEIKIRTNKQQLIKGGIVCNNIRDIQSSEIRNKDKSTRGVLIQLDTNNVPVSNEKLSLDSIAEIINHAFSKLRTGLVKELI